jgi:hypothetical protein
MPDNNNVAVRKCISLKGGSLLALSLLAILLLLSLVFYKERMLFIDAPHNLFLIINSHQFHIEEQRYGSFISQLLPLTGSWLQLPVGWLMALYSISFNLFFLIAGCLLVFKYKNYELAILLALYLSLFTSATFFWPNNEVHQGICWLLLAVAANFSISARRRTSFFTVLFFIASFFLAIWTHPLVMLIALYLWFFLWIRKADWPFTFAESVLYSFILIVISVCKFYRGMNHGYDSSKIETITNFKLSTIGQIFTSPQLRLFFHNCLTNYWLAGLLFVAGIFAILRKRQYLLAAFTIVSAAGYLLLVCITFRDGNSNLFYIESEYMPLALICSIPFVYFIIPILKPRWSMAFLTIIFIVRLGYILHAAPTFTNRVAYLEKINHKMKEKNLTKIIIPDVPDSLNSVLLMSWGTPVESIFLSKLKGESPQRTFIVNPDPNPAVYTNSNDTLIGCWQKLQQKQLNRYYFEMDTSTVYKVIHYAELMN